MDAASGANSKEVKEADVSPENKDAVVGVAHIEEQAASDPVTAAKKNKDSGEGEVGGAGSNQMVGSEEKDGGEGDTKLMPNLQGEDLEAEVGDSKVEKTVNAASPETEMVVGDEEPSVDTESTDILAPMLTEQGPEDSMEVSKLKGMVVVSRIHNSQVASTELQPPAEQPVVEQAPAEASLEAMESDSNVTGAGSNADGVVSETAQEDACNSATVTE